MRAIADREALTFPACVNFVRQQYNAHCSSKKLNRTARIACRAHIPKQQQFSNGTRAKLAAMYDAHNRDLLGLVRAASARGMLTTPVREVQSVADLF